MVIKITGTARRELISVTINGTNITKHLVDLIVALKHLFHCQFYGKLMGALTRSFILANKEKKNVDIDTAPFH